MDENKLRQALLIRLAAAFPRDNISDATVQLYASELTKLDVGLLEVVIDQAINHSRGFPTIGDLRDSYNAHYRRHQDETPALPIAAVPMPSHIKEQWHETMRRIDERAKELDAKPDKVPAPGSARDAALIRARQEFPHVRGEVKKMQVQHRVAVEAARRSREGSE